MSTLEVSVTVAAPSARLWEVIGDPTTMDSLTAECVRMQWVEGSSGPALGAKFRGTNRSGWRRWSTTCTICDYRPEEGIAWEVTYGPLPIARWSYVISPDGSGASVTLTERFEDRRGAVMKATGPLVRGTSDFESLNRRNMEATLAKVKERAEA